ncbi:MAG: YebC/PmpR family DNA-binding transcriptional regulator [Sandaracinus sp.]
MGRIFETRKHTMFARWNKMAKAFTRISRDIAIAVKSGGPSVESNPALRRAVQNARAANMPKEKVDAAIKRAAGQDQKDYETIVYEGYAPHGIAVLVVTATDNPQRTVANVRSIFKDWGGNMGQAGTVGFLFKHMGVFRLSPDGYDHDEVELELIDHGLEELGETTNDKGERQVIVRSAFEDFGRLQSAIEAKKLPLVSAESEYIATTHTELDEARAKEVLELADALEQDDDVQQVFTNLA